MPKYPDRQSAIYTALIGIKLEPELKKALDHLKITSNKDVPEAIRIKLRELVRELAA